MCMCTNLVMVNGLLFSMYIPLCFPGSVYITIVCNNKSGPSTKPWDMPIRNGSRRDIRIYVYMRRQLNLIHESQGLNSFPHIVNMFSFIDIMTVGVFLAVKILARVLKLRVYLCDNKRGPSTNPWTPPFRNGVLAF